MKTTMFSVSIVLSVLASLVACDGDDTPMSDASAVKPVSTVDPGPSPVTPDGSVLPDAFAPKPDAPAADTAAHLNIANDHIVLLDGFRFCALGNSGATPPTFADVIDAPAYPTKTFKDAKLPGLAVGRGFRLPSLIPSYEKTRLRFVAYFEESLDLLGFGNLSCKDLVKNSLLAAAPDAGDAGAPPNDKLLEGLDFEFVADFPAGTFVDKKSYALVITGCARTTAPADQVRCYQFDGANPKSTLNMYARELDQSLPTDPKKNRVQMIHGSDRMLTFNEPAINQFLTYDIDDPSKDVPIADLNVGIPYAMSGPALPKPSLEVQAITDTQALFIHLANADDEDSLQKAVDATDTPLASITANKAYTFVVVGSPTAAPEINGKRNFLHIHNILFPND